MLGGPGTRGTAERPGAATNGAAGLAPLTNNGLAMDQPFKGVPGSLRAETRRGGVMGIPAGGNEPKKILQGPPECMGFFNGHGAEANHA